MARGSIQKRTGKRGVVWTAVVELTPDASGKRRQRRISGRTRREVEREMNALLTDVERGTYVDSRRVTVGEYLAAWLTGAESGVRPSTLKQYKVAVRRLQATFGSMRLSRLMPEHIEAFYGELLKQGLSPATIRVHHAVLSKALKQAVQRRYIAYNPCTHVTPPRIATPELHVWDAEQARAFLAGSADDELAPLWLLLLATGMRRGEAVALRWRDVDLERGVVSITRTVTHGAQQRWEIREPKSEAGRRAVPIPPSVVDVLRVHKAGQDARRELLGDGWPAESFVFERGDGTLLDPNRVTIRFNRMVQLLGLPPIRLHDLRHTSATLMLAGGVHPKVAQERLGHANVSMTLNTYSHVTEGMQRQAAAQLAETLGISGARDQIVTELPMMPENSP